MRRTGWTMLQRWSGCGPTIAVCASTCRPARRWGHAGSSSGLRGVKVVAAPLGATAGCAGAVFAAAALSAGFCAGTARGAGLSASAGLAGGGSFASARDIGGSGSGRVARKPRARDRHRDRRDRTGRPAWLRRLRRAFPIIRAVKVEALRSRRGLVRHHGRQQEACGDTGKRRGKSQNGRSDDRGG